MSLEVIGAGWGRTATNSLKLALEKLDYGVCHHMWEVAKDQERLVPLWNAALDGQPETGQLYSLETARQWTGPSLVFGTNLHKSIQMRK